MRFAKSAIITVLANARSINMLTYLACISPARMHYGEALRNPYQNSKDTDHAIENRNVKCFICKNASCNSIGIASSCFVNVHYFDTHATQSDAHYANLTCLLSDIAESPNISSLRNKVFECKMCGKEASTKSIANTLVAEMNKYMHSCGDDDELFLMLLPLFLEHPTLLEISKNHFETNASTLVICIRAMIINNKIEAYLNEFMDKHNFILFFHPRNILITDNGGDANLEGSNRRLIEATPQEISRIFEKEQIAGKHKLNKILARFLFYALELSTASGFAGGGSLRGPILEYLDLLSAERLMDFLMKGVISRKAFWMKYTARIRDFVKEKKRGKHSNKPSDSLYTSLGPRRDDISPLQKKVLNIKFTLPVIICKLKAEEENHGYIVNNDARLCALFNAVRKLDKEFVFILQNNLVRDIFVQYISDPLLRIIYERDDGLTGIVLKTKNELIEISNAFLDKLLARVSKEDVEKVRELADSIEGCSIPFIAKRAWRE